MMTAARSISYRSFAQNLTVPMTPLSRNSLAILIISLAGRLSRGAAAYYQQHFDINMAEFRILTALALTKGMNIGEVAFTADVDKAAASRSLRQLEQRGLVALTQQTNSRGRAAIVQLTDEGRYLERDLRKTARKREKRLVATLDAAERGQIGTLLNKLVENVPIMNKE